MTTDSVILTLRLAVLSRAKLGEWVRRDKLGISNIM